MSGLYNMVAGVHPLATEMLVILGYGTKEDREGIPRLRDVYLYPEEIRILTRTGGGNRDEYAGENELMTIHPHYLRNWDDGFDSTYAWFAYKWPEKYREVLQNGLEAIQEKRPDLLPENLKSIFDGAVAAMKKPD